MTELKSLGKITAYKYDYAPEFGGRRGLKFFYPSKILCTDNAAMIACRGYYQKTFADSTLNAVPNLGL